MFTWQWSNSNFAAPKPLQNSKHLTVVRRMLTAAWPRQGNPKASLAPLDSGLVCLVLVQQLIYVYIYIYT